MLKIPKIAIVGRPNVGKSALFNRLLGERIAIVDEAEGVTRDRLVCPMEYNGYYFELIDTGGIDPRNTSTFNDEVRAQAHLAIDEADAIIMVVNLQTGILSLDDEIARLLLRTKKPLLLAINKVDHPSKEPEIHIFRKLGIKDQLAVSAQHGYNILEINDWIISKLAAEPVQKPETGLKIAVIGRPNVGKSTLLNFLLDEKRCIVSPIAGTTRDSLDCHVVYKQKPYTFIDTAGIRRKSKHQDVIEKFAHIRTENAIERCDVVLLLLDSNAGMTAQEKRIAKFIEQCGKGCVLFFNKWDQVKGFRMEHCLEAVRKQVSFLEHCPAIFGSALTGRNLDKIFEEMAKVQHWREQRISTGELNRFLEKAIQFNHPPMIKGRRLRIYYLTQVSCDPPTFVLFVNSLEMLDHSWKRYLMHKLRDSHPFTGLPMRFILRDKTGAHSADFELMEEMDNQAQV